MSYQTIRLADTSAIGVNSDNVISGGNWVGDVYTGAGEQNDYTYVGVNLQTDEAGTLTFEFSQDGVTWSQYPVTEFSVAANINEVHGAWKGTRWVRPRFTGTGGRTSFKLRTMYSDVPITLTAPLNQSIGSDQDATVVRAVAIGEDPTGAYTNQRVDGRGFATTENLTAGEVYTTDVLDLQGYTQVETHIQSDAAGTLTFEFLAGPNHPADVVRTLSVPYTPPGFRTFGAPAFTPYVKYTFTASTSSSNFYYDTKFTTKSINGQILALEDFISPSMVANLGRNVIAGKKPGPNNLYSNVAIDSENRLDVSIPKSAFGEVKTAELTPVIQASFPYPVINTKIWSQTLSSSGSITAESSTVSVSAGAANSYADLKTIRQIKYRPGQGVTVRFTSIFTTPVVGSRQEIGVGDDTDGFFFTTSGAEFAINRRRGGVDNFTLQSDWNLDPGDGSQVLPVIDFTKANVHEIQYQWLGYGAITYKVEDPVTGEFIPVHREQYANANTLPSVFNPTLPLTVKATNTTNTTPIVLKSSSLAAFVEGKIVVTGPQFSQANTVAADDETPVMGIGIQNKQTYSGADNRIPVIPESFTVVNLNDDPAIVELYKDVDTSGETFIDVDTTNSAVEYMSAGTATWPVSTLFNTVVCPPNDSTTIEFSSQATLFPTENVVATFTVPGAGTDTANVTCIWNWQEDL